MARRDKLGQQRFVPMDFGTVLGSVENTHTCHIAASRRAVLGPMAKIAPMCSAVTTTVSSHIYHVNGPTPNGRPRRTTATKLQSLASPPVK